MGGLNSNNPDMIRTLNSLIEVTTAKGDAHGDRTDTTSRKSSTSSSSSEKSGHCLRCHKSYNPNERSRCHAPHPESMVSMVGQDEDGTDFVCRCCKSGFRLFKMDFYEESTNSLLTGHCYSGYHTSDPAQVKYMDRGGCAMTCNENGCVEFYV